MNISFPITLEREIFTCAQDQTCHTSSTCPFRHHCEFLGNQWLFQLKPELLAPIVHQIKFENIIQILSELNKKLCDSFVFKARIKKQKSSSPGVLTRTISGKVLFKKIKRAQRRKSSTFKQRLNFGEEKLIQLNNFISGTTVDLQKLLIHNIQ